MDFPDFVQSAGVVVNILVLVAAALLAYISQKSKNQINDKVEEIRRDIQRDYVPATFDAERRQTLTQRIAENEEEIKRNRDMYHRLNNELTALILGKFDRLDTLIREIMSRQMELERESRDKR